MTTEKEEEVQAKDIGNIYNKVTTENFPKLQKEMVTVYHPIPRLIQNGSRILISDPKLLS
jgi:hypothetical protein